MVYILPYNVYCVGLYTMSTPCYGVSIIIEKKVNMFFLHAKMYLYTTSYVKSLGKIQGSSTCSR